MSVEAMAIVLHHSKSKGTDMVILLGVANHDGDGGSWPSKATLAKYAKVDERSVKRSLRKLEAMGELITHTQDGGTHRTPDGLRPNRYEITVSCPDGCDRTTNHRVKE